MANDHRLLVLALRLFALVDLLALGAVAMPREWMEVLHALAGLGEMPEGPLVGYLTRSASVLYAVHGGMILFISFDVKRYWPLIRLLGVVTIIQGCVVFAIDMAVGMSWPWTIVEAPCFIAAGAMVLITQRLVKAD
jgi:hypothetical protein